MEFKKNVQNKIMENNIAEFNANYLNFSVDNMEFRLKCTRGNLNYESIPHTEIINGILKKFTKD